MVCKNCNTLNLPGIKICDTCGERLKIKRIKFKAGDKNRMVMYKLKNLSIPKKVLRYLLPAILVFIIIATIFVNYDKLVNALLPPVKESLMAVKDSIQTKMIPPPKKEIPKKRVVKKVKTPVVKKDDTPKHNSYEGMVSSDRSDFYGNDNKKMVLVPAQVFTMGDDNDKLAKPAHEVKIDPFYMDVYEVTNGEFINFLEATNYKNVGDYPHLENSKFNKLRQPMINVEYKDAEAYAKWAGKRLPTEEEWECAARGGKGYLYATGEDILPRLANYGKSIGEGATTLVGSYQPNPYGIYDLNGNVCEIVAGVLVPYSGEKKFTQSWGNRSCRGGSWLSMKEQLKVYNRRSIEYQSGPKGNRGFRCVISLSAAN